MWKWTSLCPADLPRRTFQPTDIHSHRTHSSPPPKHTHISSQVEEVQAICSADYSYTPEEYWSSISGTARDFIDKCLVVDPGKRMTAIDCLKHPWLVSDTSAPVAGEQDLLAKGLKAKFDAKKVRAGPPRFGSRFSEGQDTRVQRTRLQPHSLIDDANGEHVPMHTHALLRCALSPPPFSPCVLSWPSCGGFTFLCSPASLTDTPSQTWRKAVFATRFINAANKGAQLHRQRYEQLSKEDKVFIDSIEKDTEAATKEEVDKVLSFSEDQGTRMETS